jgi:hypothetical protein
MGLLSYIEEHKLDALAPEVQRDDKIDALFFDAGYVAGLFTLDFSDAFTSTQNKQTAFAYACEATADLLAPPSRCYPGPDFQVKVVLATDHEITADLFAFQIVQAFTFAFQAPIIPEKIRVYPAGTARGKNGLAAIESFLG